MFFTYLQGEHKEFVLLVTMKQGTTKTYQFDGFNFFETPITFTGGSFGKGVAKMRTFKINDDFLVLSNYASICRSKRTSLMASIQCLCSSSCGQCRNVSRCIEFVSS